MYKQFGILWHRRTWWCVGIATLGAILLSGGAAGAGNDEMTGQILLQITGDSNAEVSVDCRLSRDGEDEQLSFKPTIPYEAKFEATGMDCTIKSDGQVTILATKDSNVTRTTSSGGTTRLNLQ